LAKKVSNKKVGKKVGKKVMIFKFQMAPLLLDLISSAISQHCRKVKLLVCASSFYNINLPRGQSYDPSSIVGTCSAN
jgi:hypothetical protein